MPKKNKTKKKGWSVIITEDDGEVKFIFDGDVDMYRLIGLFEVEIELMKKKLLEKVK